MKAIAKNNFKYDEYPYTNWIKDHKYECQEDDHILQIQDEQGVTFYFSGMAKSNLGEIFDFVMEEVKSTRHQIGETMRSIFKRVNLIEGETIKEPIKYCSNCKYYGDLPICREFIVCDHYCCYWD